MNDITTYKSYLDRANAKGIEPISPDEHASAWKALNYYTERIESDDWLTPDEFADSERIRMDVLLFDPPKETKLTFNDSPRKLEKRTFQKQWKMFDLSEFQRSGRCKPAPPQPPKNESAFFDSASFNKAFTYVEADENGMIECPHCGLHFHDSMWHVCHIHTK